MQDIVVITGPTACGKSDIAIDIASKLGGEILNGDSVQVYKDFNIATCKPDQASLEALPHHLYDFCSPDEPWNVGRFVKEAEIKLREMDERKVLPIVVGGSGLYVRSLLTGLIDAPEGSARARSVVENKILSLEDQGLSSNEVSQSLHAWLGVVDSETQKALHPHDRTRIVRALLVNLTTGKSIESLRQSHKSRQWRYRAVVFSISYNREALYKRIDARVQLMLKEGLIDEVKDLVQRYGRDVQPFQSIGYRQTLQHLDGELSIEQLVAGIQMETRRFAKRQLTWWRNQPSKLGWSIESQIQSDRVEAVGLICDKVKGYFSNDLESQEIAPVFQAIELV